MAVKKEARLQVGKALLDGSLALDEARAKYKVGQTTVYNWERECRESVGENVIDGIFSMFFFVLCPFL
jgi:transposase